MRPDSAPLHRQGAREGCGRAPEFLGQPLDLMIGKLRFGEFLFVSFLWMKFRSGFQIPGARIMAECGLLTYSVGAGRIKWLIHKKPFTTVPGTALAFIISFLTSSRPRELRLQTGSETYTGDAVNLGIEPEMSLCSSHQTKDD